MSYNIIDQIGTQLKLLGLREGDTVLVHSSLKSLSRIPQSPEGVILGLQKAIGTEGTLLMPALSYEKVTSENPVFHVCNTPSNVGAIPEFFRKMPGVVRSVNPTHSVCGIGKYAVEILGKHQLDDTPAGENSPFRLLPKYNGKILFIGCGLKPNTSMHAIEELTAPPYLFAETVTYTVIGEEMDNWTMKVKRHNFKGYEQRYDRVKEILSHPFIKEGRVLSAKVYLINSGELWQKAHHKLTEDPFYFVDKI